jgi:hypothetical protein
MATRARGHEPVRPDADDASEFEEAAPTVFDPNLQKFAVADAARDNSQLDFVVDEARTRESKDVIQTLAKREARLSQEMQTVRRPEPFEREMPTAVARPRGADLQGLAQRPAFKVFDLDDDPPTPPPAALPPLAPPSEPRTRPSATMARVTPAPRPAPRGRNPVLLVVGLALLGMAIGAMTVVIVLTKMGQVASRESAAVPAVVAPAPAPTPAPPPPRAAPAPAVAPAPVEPAAFAPAPPPARPKPAPAKRKRRRR